MNQHLKKLVVFTLLFTFLFVSTTGSKAQTPPPGDISDPTRAGQPLPEMADMTYSAPTPQMMTRTLRIVSWDAVRGRDDMVLTNSSDGRNITRVYGELMKPANFGPEGIVKCTPAITYINSIATGSLVVSGVRQADVFYGNMISATASPIVPLSTTEAAELVAFMNAGGIVYVSGDGNGQGQPWNPLFTAMGITDRFENNYITSGSISLPLVTTPLTNGAFGTVGYMAWTPYSTITTSTLQKVITAGGDDKTFVAEGVVGAGYLSATGDVVAHDVNTANAPYNSNMRYMLNLFAKGCQAPKLQIYQTIPSTLVNPGDAISITLHVNNLSAGAINAVQISDLLPPQLTPVSYLSSGLSLTQSPGAPYTWQAGTLAGGATGTITINATVNASLAGGTTILNTATISGMDAATPVTDSSALTLNVQNCYATPNDGATVYRVLQSAVDAAPAGGTVKVAGYCSGVNLLNAEYQTVYIDKNLTLRGGYSPTNWTAFNLAAPSTLDALQRGHVVTVGPWTVTLQNFNLINGRTVGYGGGLYGKDATTVLTLLNMNLQNNTAVNSNGGGLFTYGTLTVTGSSFVGNTAKMSGGGAAVYASQTATFTRTLFKDNQADEGGGIYTFKKGVALTQSQLINNSARNGGGIYVYGAELDASHIINSVFARNTATTNGAAILIFLSNTAGLTGEITHTTIATATAGTVSAVYCGAGTLTVKNSIISGYQIGIKQQYSGVVSQDYNLLNVSINTEGTVTGGTHNLTGDPKFVSPPVDNYHLGNGSPAIDHATNLGVTIDLDGVSRPKGTASDIGAYEWMNLPYRIYLPSTVR